jgi:hypothetical protein
MPRWLTVALLALGALWLLVVAFGFVIVKLF